MNSIIVYELNEVPVSVIHRYISRFPNSAISFIVDSGFFGESITYDTGELHPWSSWPSFHRGVPNSIHKINFLNQPLDPSSYAPIWQKLYDHGANVGVFGSLQSFFPYLSDHRRYSFYLPDTFSPAAIASSRDLSIFQEFNLICSRQISNFNLSGYSSLRLLFLLLLSRTISFSSFFSLVSHLIKEIESVI